MSDYPFSDADPSWYPRVPECNWGQAADAVILEGAGDGFPEPEGDAQ